MQVLPLDTVRTRIQIGVPLPFGVHDADRSPLLAAGQVIDDAGRLDELLELGAVVDVAELESVFGADDPLFSAARPPAADAIPIAALPQRWMECAERVSAALSASAGERLAAIALAARNVELLVDRSANLAMSQIVRQATADAAHYGIIHAMNTAVAGLVAARALGWSVDEQRRALHAGLTMNISMLGLQGQLARQVSALTVRQRQLIHEHPLRSAEMLEAAGVEDEQWLAAVREHHERPDGKGYPHGTQPSTELAQLLRYADIYTALMSERATRPAMNARDAAREVYALADGSALCQALIKSFGVFPPGCFVRLASDEIGVVTGNGQEAHHPRVAVLARADGQAQRTPQWRNTAEPRHRIVALLSESALPLRVGSAMLACAIAGDPG
ncbi:MAG TPA: HD domain-containing phosphohydrolase [Rubrivivax sp.]|nr:hypothetical protein [Burkholderiales bacterium]HNU11472.1 HD domain-containing phosphohydrolase [Rubrivivax sp.]